MLFCERASATSNNEPLDLCCFHDDPKGLANGGQSPSEISSSDWDVLQEIPRHYRGRGDGPRARPDGGVRVATPSSMRCLARRPSGGYMRNQ